MRRALPQEAVRLEKQETTMDPLAPFAISAAAQSIKPIARGVEQLGEFAAVLAGGMADAAHAGEGVMSAAAPESLESLKQKAGELVDRLLRMSNIAPTPSLRLNVQPDGELRLAQDHPRAAEIEALLNGDESLREVTSQLNSAENSPIQLHWPADNLTQAGLPPYTMGEQRPFGG